MIGIRIPGNDECRFVRDLPGVKDRVIPLVFASVAEGVGKRGHRETLSLVFCSHQVIETVGI
jgi:hypothetical protein